MFCKRCDDAYHCYCQQPAHKNVSSGPYLCPKHTKCHSCASTVPGNGLSVRWFLGYTCCDACGRLFVKGNYCPVCLKVYRDSESTPMVCCDICQRWVHCHCDGISDEKYMQFQVDNNLQYRCATCRGECYKVRDLEDAVQELWRRRDKADRELTASLRAAAGLPTKEEIFSVQPYSDDDDDDDPPLAKNEHGRSLKFSLKGRVDKAPKKKSSSKNSVKKKGYNALPFGRTEPPIKSHTDAQSAGFIADDKFKDVDVQSSRSTEFEIAGSLNDAVWSSNQARHHKNSRDKMNNRRSHGVDMEQTGRSADKSINTKGPKLVIHLGARNKNVTSSSRSDAANLHPGQDLITSNDSEDMFQHRANGRHLNRSKFSDIKGDTLDHDDQNRLRLRGKEGSTIKIRKLNPEIPDAKQRVSFGKRSETPSLRGQEAPDGLNGSNKTKELKPLLRLKFKNPYADRQTSLAQSGEVEKSSIKGQRSKRKTPSPLMGDPLFVEEHEGADCLSDEDMGEIMDANWIIQKLGKDAIGKKVEVHQRSNRTWHKGTVHEVFEGTSVVSVTLDDGKTSNVDLGKQGIRFYSQKRRW
ncbi:RING/FYVE/PHD-type zinc finger family protein [Artemisia annua]|uniref:RING/FYVE/PHD-type zinc finger family protein n=1 Tax=Artemisia annua TaxID=35608 RepID=A0A2U1QBS4_ARTAN|nr:RING/FYVE/PHD-type zinc finger family protein [Artemisia annua]